ncbi:hypothetical protein AgCh_035441 [Apium graveolens]
MLELDEDEHFTLDELYEMGQFMAYLAKKNSNIRFKKPRSKIRCFNCDELGHFATECRKPKKSLDDTDVDDEDEEVGNHLWLLSMEKHPLQNQSKKTGEVALKGARKGSLFVADLDSVNKDRELVRDMPNMEFSQDEFFDACQKGKMSKTVNSISATLQLIHMDLFGPSKDETPHIIIEHIKKIEKQAKNQNCVKRLRNDNGIEFRNVTLTEFYKDKGIVQEFSAARTPQ